MSAVLEQNQSDELLDGPGELFKKIRNHISTSQGQGQVFERLIKAFLKDDPLFKERFKQVWLWSEWPGRQGEHDSGIDLVAEESDGGVCAIQCKFYGENEYIGRSNIDTFLARSGKEPFTTRLFVSTTEHWSTTAEKVLANQQVPVQKIGIAELANSPFDWSRFDPGHPDQLFKHTPKEIRSHQRKAIDDVKSGFETADRGKLIMACGTGKTFTALRLAEEIVPSGGLVLFCVPSISLLSQSLRAWASDATRPLHAMAVCSDAQVTRDSEDMHIYDLALPATTSVNGHDGSGEARCRGPRFVSTDRCGGAYSTSTSSLRGSSAPTLWRTCVPRRSREGEQWSTSPATQVYARRARRSPMRPAKRAQPHHPVALRCPRSRRSCQCCRPGLSVVNSTGITSR